MIRLAAFDIDNTLFSHATYTVPASAVTALDQLHRSGVTVVLSTGRPWFTVGAVLAQGVRPDYLMASDGHTVHDAAGRLLAARFFDQGQMERLTAYCLARNFILYYKFLTMGCAYNRGADFAARYPILVQPGVYQDCPGRDYHQPGRMPTGALVAMPRERAWEYGMTVDPTVRMVAFAPDSYDVTLADASKGTALAALMAEKGIAADQAIAFGDSANDIELLRACGTKVAMGRCAPQLAAMADYLTADIEQDGLARGLAHYGLIPQSFN